MYLKDEITVIKRLLIELQEILLDLAEKHLQTIMPGYTHLQKAQPITLAHHLLAYVQMFGRDVDRLSNCYVRTDVMPLGSGALAATTFAIDRYRVAELLGFPDITENSLDGVSDRDFAVEFCAAASLIMMHLSRFCEELIIWSTDEFQFIEMDDAYSTGSSIMPQKKNPDVAELIRGKSGRVFGDLMTLLTVMKALPLAYNKDMQEDKEALFDAVDTVKKCLIVFAPMLKTIKVNQPRMREGAGRGFTNATDLADYLVRKGLPFRSAHEVVGRLVLYCTKNSQSLEELTLEELNRESGLGDQEALGITASSSGWFNSEVYAAIRLEICVSVRQVFGGPAPDQVRLAITRARERIGQSG
jgi:argininosuccinate lyase